MTPTPLTRTMGRIQRVAFVVGILGSALMALGFALDRDQFHRSYLMREYVAHLGITNRKGWLASILIICRPSSVFRWCRNA